jgi:hypothetical protein
MTLAWIWKRIAQLQSLRERALHSTIPEAAKTLSDACNANGAAGCDRQEWISKYAQR